MYNISVIMPTYNAQDTVARAIYSVLDTPRFREIEIIVVDDCSNDDTQNIITQMQQVHENIRLFVMPENSGSPSAPRNLGIEKATGTYITFLDDDDIMDAKRLMDMLDYAIIDNIDFLKGYLMVLDKDGRQTEYNRIEKAFESTEETIKLFVQQFSLGVSIIVRRLMFIEHNIRFDVDLRIGEDLVLNSKLLACCPKIRYIDNFFLYYDRRNIDSSNVSSMQKCGDREISHRITAWQRAQEILSSTSINYNELRLHVGVRDLLLCIVRYSDGISKEVFLKLHEFIQNVHPVIKDKVYISDRYDEIYNAILQGDYETYTICSKRRLLITGYDLKFILPVIPYLEGDYNIRVDEWVAHDVHDKKQSEKMAEWADIIWCEWLLGNAVFYSKIKTRNQRLVIRTHRFEVTRDFGNRVNYDAVDMVFAVVYYYFDKFQKQFNIPATKMRLFPHYADDTIYTTDKSPDARFHIGMVGILPSLKGYQRGLELIKQLRDKDPRFKLYLMGKIPSEVSWVRSDPTEMMYYEKCEAYIKEHNLQDAIVYGGFLPRESLYKDLGYVLSLSDIEAFHTAIAEGACAGCMGLLLNSWAGVEYVYPKEYICDSIEEMAQRILRASTDTPYYEDQVRVLREFVIDSYGIQKFLENMRLYLKQLFI